MNQSGCTTEETLQQVQKDVGKIIVGYSTFILGLKTLDQLDQPTPLGSATFIQYGKDKGLLTAQHVIEETDYFKCEGIGLAISRGVHRFTIPRRCLQEQTSNPGCEEYGPDMAFIKIPDLYAARIAIQKAFWQMDTYRKRISEILTTRNDGFWMLFGCPSDYQKPKPGNPHFGNVLDLGGLMGASGKPRFLASGGYDYFDVPVVYEAGNELPATFKGVSGGGLWFVPLTKNDLEPEKTQVGHPTLMGVPFYQTAVEDNRRVIRCHGPKSIYIKMQNILESV